MAELRLWCRPSNSWHFPKMPSQHNPSSFNVHCYIMMLYMKIMSVLSFLNRWQRGRINSQQVNWKRSKAWVSGTTVNGIFHLVPPTLTCHFPILWFIVRVSKTNSWNPVIDHRLLEIDQVALVQLPHFVDEESEAKKGEGVCQRWCISLVVEARWESRLPDSQSRVFATIFCNSRCCTKATLQILLCYHLLISFSSLIVSCI